MSSTNMPMVTPQYLGQSTVGALKAIMALVIVLPTIFICLRCYVRICIKRVFGLDDIVAVIATIILLAYAGVLLAATDKGLGRHMQYIEVHGNVRDVSLCAQIAQSLAIMACTLGKSAFAITLMRIFVQPWVLRVLWFVLITMNLVNVLCAIFVFVQCEDPRALWDSSIQSNCWPTYVFTNFSLFVGSYSAAQDFLLAFLPCIIILRLNMKRTESVAIVLSMSLGVFAGIAATVKSTYLVTLSNQTDRFYALPPLFMWAAAEDALAIIAATIPTLRPLLYTKAASSTRPSQGSYPLQVFDRANDAFYPASYYSELNTTIKADQPAASYGKTAGAKDIVEKCMHDESRLECGDNDARRKCPNLKGHILATTQVEMTYH
ncbi:unnamed protein product [Discula destructiva]